MTICFFEPKPGDSQQSLQMLLAVKMLRWASQFCTCFSFITKYLYADISAPLGYSHPICPHWPGLNVCVFSLYVPCAKRDVLMCWAPKGKKVERTVKVACNSCPNGSVYLTVTSEVPSAIPCNFPFCISTTSPLFISYLACAATFSVWPSLKVAITCKVVLFPIITSASSTGNVSCSAVNISSLNPAKVSG